MNDVMTTGRIRGFKNSAVTAAALDLSSTVPELSFRTETSNLEFDVGSLKLSPRFFLAITISGAVSVSSIAVDWIMSVDFNALNGIQVAAVSAQLTGIDVSINFGNVFYKTVLGFTETLIENNLESAINNALPGVSSSLSSAMNEAVSGLLMQTCTA
ncbi:unnamed protein product [Cyprideis torosa]|uniref:Uncharacterized protein n=1 Tax=Cyprideis torosa TaxID=163714 RepID=A0A7R8ZJZ9_9CRUS|nr:unnamed protein product [Cyprideis torosa]CAG0883413.1 unnamed protein product [Cyprideis torosa]